SRPVRPIASWIVATPNLASFATASAGARWMARTAIPDLPIISLPLPDVSRDADFPAHDQARGTQQRRALDLRGIVRIHRQHDREFAGRMLHGKILARSLGYPRQPVRD